WETKHEAVRDALLDERVEALDGRGKGRTLGARVVTFLVGGFINVTAVLFPKWNGAFSFNLLCRVKRVGLTERGREFLAQGRSTNIDIDEYAAVLHSWGSGDKNVLFLHGWLSNSQRWAPYLSHFDLQEYTIYVLDAPGHGMAAGKYLNLEIYRKALIKSLGLIGEVDTLVCHSLGGLVGGYGFLHDRKLRIGRFVIMGAPSGMDAIFAYFEHRIGLSPKALENLETKVNSVLQLPHEQIAISRFFSEVDRPVLVVHDTGDRIAPFEPIRKASDEVRHQGSASERKNNELSTYFTQGENHSLQSANTVARVVQYIKE
ncbi:MAG: alpha/beta hydrolase, partial [Bacteroidota bacterium]